MNAEKFLKKFIMLIKAAFLWFKKYIYITATALINYKYNCNFVKYYGNLK